MAVRIFKKSWWVDFRFNGARIRKRSPLNTKAGAEDYEVLLRRKLAQGESIDGNAYIASKSETFEQFAWKWFEVYVIPNNKYSERKTKKSILNCSLIPSFGKMPIEKITAQDVEQFKAKCIKEGAARKTVNNKLAVYVWPPRMSG